MSEQQNIGKGFLKEKLGNFQVNPPAGVWDSISSQIGGRRDQRRMIILVFSAAASIALAVTLGINFFGSASRENIGFIEKPHNEQNIRELSEPDPGSVREMLTETETLAEKLKSAPGEFQEDIPALARVNSEGTDHPEKDLAGLKEDHLTVKSPGRVADEAIEPVDGVFLSDLGPEAEETGMIMNPPDEPPDEVSGDLVPELGNDPQGHQRWVVGAVLSPLYSFRDAEASAMAGASQFESGLVAYAGGVNVSYKTDSRLTIESGILFNKMGIAIGAPGIQLFNQSLDFSPLGQETGRAKVTSVTNSVGNIVATSGDVYVNNYMLNAASEANAFTDNYSSQLNVADQGIHQYLDYLELPFNLRYTLVDRTIEFQLVGGMSTNFLVNNYVTMETETGTKEIGYLTNIKSVNYSGNAGFGMVYHLGNQFSLRMEPRFRYFLNSVNDASLPATRPYTLGLFTGLSYTF